MRLLLIGQNLETTASVRLMLIKEKFICETTDFGDDGLEPSKFSDYDVILFDLSGPNKNGYEALRRLRKRMYPHSGFDPFKARRARSQNQGSRLWQR